VCWKHTTQQPGLSFIPIPSAFHPAFPPTDRRDALLQLHRSDSGLRPRCYKRTHRFLACPLAGEYSNASHRSWLYGTTTNGANSRWHSPPLSLANRAIPTIGPGHTAQQTMHTIDRTGASCGEMMAVSAFCAKESEKRLAGSNTKVITINKKSLQGKGEYTLPLVEHGTRQRSCIRLNGVAPSLWMTRMDQE
jgi:hypothetical protein